MSTSKVSWSIVKKELRNRSYGILSTISKDGRPHSTGVLYTTSSGSDFCLYVLTDKSSAKARNISRNPNISFAVPAPRRLLNFIPPGSIQFQGKGEIVPLTEDVKKAFSKSIALRRTLRTASSEESSTVKITLGPFVFTYAIGISIFELIGSPQSAGGKVRVERA